MTANNLAEETNRGSPTTTTTAPASDHLNAPTAAITPTPIAPSISAGATVNGIKPFPNLNGFKMEPLPLESTTPISVPQTLHRHLQTLQLPMLPRKEAFCIRWKGFHGNMAHCLEDIRTDEDFVDVTLACEDGSTAHAHRLVLASCSPYFRRILKENSCQHPVIILNEVTRDTLDALMTYMYHGQVLITEDRLQTFFKVATSLEIKGIAEGTPTAIKEEPLFSSTAQGIQSQHPVGDLSLLAAAATSTLPAGPPLPTSSSSITKRKKTMPRRLDVAKASKNINALATFPSYPLTPNDENSPLNDNLAINLSMRNPMSPQMMNGPNTPDDLTKSPFVAKAGLLTIPNPSNFASMLKKEEPRLGLPTSPVALDMSSHNMQNGAKSTASSDQSSERSEGSPTENLGDSTGAPSPNAMEKIAEETAVAAAASAALAPVTASTTPEQMAALLGPSWKSRQPRLCQYCQRMFSNKFNLKQHILNMHTVGRELHCEICQKKVKNKWYLRRHHVTHHGAPLKK